MGHTENRRAWGALTALALFFLVFAVYLPSLHNGFVYDDNMLILEKKALEGPGQALKLFVKPLWEHLPYYRPVSEFLMLGQKALFGEWEAGYHAFNAVLAGMVALAAWLMLSLPVFNIRPWAAFFGAAVMGVHPLASAAVYQITSLETLTACGLSILSVWAWVRGGRGGYVLALAFFGLALLCKEPVVVIPGVYFWADLLGISPGGAWARSKKTGFARYGFLFGRMLGPAFLLAMYFLIRHAILLPQRTLGFAFWDEPFLLPLSYLYALQTTFAPFWALYYEPAVRTWLSPTSFALGMAVLAGLAAAVFRSDDRDKQVLVFFAGWFALALIPTSNILVQETLFAERYVFFSLMGPAGFLAVVFSGVKAPLARRASGFAAVSILVVLAVFTINRHQYYADDPAFYLQWRLTSPEAPEPRAYLGATLLKQGRLEQARIILNEALEREPNNWVAGDIKSNLGLIHQHQGEKERALELYDEALELWPRSVGARVNRGAVLYVLERYDEAEKSLLEAIWIKPGAANAHFLLGVLYKKQQKLTLARTHLEAAVMVKPSLWTARFHLADLLAARGEYDHARQHLTAILKNDPGNEPAAAALKMIPGRPTP